MVHIAMKKLQRNAEKFDVLELFSDMAAVHGYDLNDPVALNDFLNRIKASFEENRKNTTTIYGKRVESLFAYVAGALGKTILLKQEDSGDIYFSGDDLLAPDYRVTVDNKYQFLVEVKNCHLTDPERAYTLKKSYYRKLKRYADLNNLDIKLAIFFSKWNLWTLVSIDAFDEGSDKYTINICKAMVRNEMGILGDGMIGTTSNLELHLLTHSDEASYIDDEGLFRFTIRDAKIYCAGNEIEEELERKIAFYLILNGTWIEEVEEIFYENKIQGVKFTFSPPDENEEQGFSSIGMLSTMISTGFKNHTSKNGDVTALKSRLDPTEFKIQIPSDYIGKNLPLWRLMLDGNSYIKSR